MKKTQRKDALRNIQKRIVSFLSVCLVVALGLGVLFTTRYTGAGLDREYSDYYNARNFKDFELISSMGVTDANLDKIRNIEGVSAAEGVMLADGVVSIGDQNRNAVVSSLTKEVSVPELVDGRLPAGRDECAIGEDFAEDEDIKVGDSIGIALSGMDALGDEEPLYEQNFIVTGLIHNPEYFKRKSTNTVSLPVKAFNAEATKGLYTEAYVRIEEPDKVSMFSSKYFDKTADTKKALEDLAIELGADRTQEMKDEAYATIDEEWAKAKAQLDDAQNQIDEGEATLNSKLAEGRGKLKTAEKTLAATVAKYNKEIKQREKELAEAQAKFDEAEEKYPAIKKTVEDSIAYYKDEIANVRKELDAIKEKLSDLEKIAEVYGKDSEQYKEKLKEIASFINEHEDTISSIFEFFHDEKVMELAEKVKEATGGELDPTGFVDKMRKYDYEKLFELSSMIATDDYEECVKSLEEYESYLEEQLEQYERYEEYIKQYETSRGQIKEKLADAKKQLADGKKKLAAEKKKYQAKIKNGWSTYYSEKAKYEAKLEEAKLLLEENTEEAEKKLQEAKDEVENMEPCNWITLDRTANAGYVTARSNITATTTAGNVFGVLFMIVTAIVCFSTLVIIIDEQKTLVGTAKAFGFFKNEILGKYLSFGAVAALAGSVLATIIGVILSMVVQKNLAGAGLVQVGVAPSVFTPGITIGATLVITAVAIIASVIACGDILRSPASMLMKGAVLKKKSRKKKESSGRGSLYSRLIIRNMADDKARVAVTISIIAFSCMLIGMGASMKLAFNGMVSRQTEVVNKYDFIVNIGDSVSEDEEAKLTDVLASEGVAYLPATVNSSLYKWDGRIDGLQLVCADTERLGEFYAVTDPASGELMEIPDDGILIQNRLHESYKINIGDKLPLLDSSLGENDAEVKGYFANYVGRTIVMSPAAYKTVFGKANDINGYYVRLDGADAGNLKNKLLAVSEDISFSEKSNFKATLDSAAQLYDIMVVVVTGMAILISFMILTNLSNIFLNRRKTELSVMRVNGFSVKQAKGYLMKETIFTTSAGIVLGVLLGAILTPIMLRILQPADLNFVKHFHVAAWVFAVVIETVFAVIINSLVFRKVKTLNLRDIA